ncbi:hypothetical protein QR680_007321 [Steinernema hermaphroditum]|uniref:ShKT domain-containing protein n=1 Tax=Steinernema hermaphroditum TaxID=289476 RepID=A0AA39M686_9BILA|nr:hypothetical protein QR680_007321 [Steinernema hermaphroditum]
MTSLTATLIASLLIICNVQDALTCPICQQPIDGQWGLWSAWSPCAYEYGAYSQTRQRSCSYYQCPGGDSQESRACQVYQVPQIPQCQTCQQPPCIACGRKKRLAMQDKLRQLKMVHSGW